jgi:GNAT superfamily N-acetyltransferase
VHTTPGRTAVALWLPTGEEGPHPPASYGARQAAVTSRWASRFEAFDATLDRHHPTGLPHHHLAMLAVRPDNQGQGIGTALLRAHHTALDSDGMPAYLEASGLGTRRIYLRHGYLDYGTVIQLPDGGPRMYPMMRQPRSRQHDAAALGSLPERNDR